MEMSRLTRDRTAEPVSRDQILRRERGEGNFHFPCSADHVQDWQPYPVDPYSCCMCDHTCMTIHTATEYRIQTFPSGAIDICKHFLVFCFCFSPLYYSYSVTRIPSLFIEGFMWKDEVDGRDLGVLL